MFDEFGDGRNIGGPAMNCRRRILDPHTGL
jgi:hypothetical protein